MPLQETPGHAVMLRAAEDLSLLDQKDLEDINEDCCHQFLNHGDLVVFQHGLLAGEELIKRGEFEDDVERLAWHNVLSQQYELMFDAQRTFVHLELAVDHARKALQVVPEDYDGDSALDLVLGLTKLLTRIYDGFPERRTASTLEELIILGRRLVALRRMERIDIDLGIDAHNLGLRLHARYRDAGGTKEDIEEAIRYQREALTALTSSVAEIGSGADRNLFQGEKIVFQLELSKKLNALYEISRAPELIAEATQLMNSVVVATPKEHKDYGSRLDLLSTRLRTCASRFVCLCDFEAAIRTAHECLRLTLAGHPLRPERISSLADAYFVRYEKQNSTSDFRCAKAYIDYALGVRDAVDAAPSVVLWTAATCYSGFFERTGDLEHISKAVMCREVAITQANPKHPFMPGILSNLSSDLLLRHTATGEVSDLNRAIQLAGRALDLVSDRDSIQRFPILSNLSSALTTRYQRTSSLWDLHHGTEYAREAIRAVPFYGVERRFFNNLANTLFLRYRRQGLSEDLDAAIDAMSRGLQSVRQGAMGDLLTLITNLAGMLRARALVTQRSSSRHDLLRAKFLCRYAIHHTPRQHRDRVLRLNTLGNILQLQVRTSSSENRVRLLNQAFDVSQEAADAVHDDPERASVFVNLGNVHNLRSKQTSHDGKASDTDVEKELDCYMKATDSIGSPPLKRIRAAIFATELLIAREDWVRSKLMVEKALDLIPFASPQSHTRSDQQHILSQISGLSATGCSVVLNAGGSAADALTILENGRGNMLGNVIRAEGRKNGSNSIITQLLERYYSLRSILDQKAIENNDLGRISSQFDTSIGAEDVERVLSEIRAVPGYEHFQLAPSIEKIRTSALNGTIIVVVSTKLRSDALIMEPERMSVLELSDVVHTDVQSRARLLTEDIANYSLKTLHSKNGQLKEQMSWLWTTVVFPILQHLKLQPQQSITDLPRLRWIGVGAFGVFPFHAAGEHNGESNKNNTLSYAISSYSPTIKSLVHAIDTGNPTLTPSDYSDMLFVSMPQTNQFRDLREVDELPARLRELGMDVQTIENNVPRKVLQSLPACTVLLCACHGISDNRNPSASYLALNTAAAVVQDSDPTTLASSDTVETVLRSIDRDGRLTVQAVSYFNTIQPGSKLPALVFLMACSTAATAALDLSDEALHLTAAFHLIGCKHVIGTLWKSIQTASVSMVVRFCAHLRRYTLSQTARLSDGWAVAASLHQAIVDERRQNPNLVLRWAPFVHFGP